ncbi:uncharacterized protein LOC133031209 [Cannabis sativa]|uniref:uncharacterized protein LOC133031209 n=1 Tax=Cannabis sativa TaxID=3483 RepID=UPI0029CA5DFF|nr:uncharacterized protein LOC133031209 [Cannabis sativa]
MRLCAIERKFERNTSAPKDDNIDRFNEIVVGLANINHKIDEESQAIILLRPLPIAYQEVKAAIKYIRDVIALEEVLAVLKLKDFELQLEKKIQERRSVLGKRKISQERKFEGFCKEYREQQGFNKSHNGDRKDKQHHHRTDSVAAAKDGDDCSTDGELSSISKSSMNREWILNSRCTYHMCPSRESFFDYRSIDGGKF